MRAVLVAIVAGFVVLAAAVYLNRGSEKIVTTFGLGLAATFLALLSVLLFGQDSSIHRAFSSIVAIDRATFLPFEYGGSIPFAPLT